MTVAVSDSVVSYLEITNVHTQVHSFFVCVFIRYIQVYFIRHWSLTYNCSITRFSWCLFDSMGFDYYWVLIPLPPLVTSRVFARSGVCFLIITFTTSMLIPSIQFVRNVSVNFFTKLWLLFPAKNWYQPISS